MIKPQRLHSRGPMGSELKSHLRELFQRVGHDRDIFAFGFEQYHGSRALKHQAAARRHGHVGIPAQNTRGHPKRIGGHLYKYDLDRYSLKRVSTHANKHVQV